MEARCSSIYKYANTEKFYGFSDIRSLLDAPFSLLLLLVIFLIHPLMGIFSLLGVFVALCIGLLIEKKVQPDQEVASDVQNEARRELGTLHNNALYCNSMGNLPFIFNKWYDKQKRFLTYQARASSVQSLGNSVSQVIMMVQVPCSSVLEPFNAHRFNGCSDGWESDYCKIYRCVGTRPTMMIVMG